MEPRQNYEELVVEGEPAALHGFVRGWAAGRGLAPEEIERGVLDCHEHHVHAEGAVEKVVEALRPGGVDHILVRRDLVEPMLQALASHGKGLRLRTRRPVLGAQFDFRYEIFSRSEAEEVRALFEARPPGVQLSPDYRPQEEADTRATGFELYAPAHDYALRARGTARGPLAGILLLHERTRQHERIRAADVVLDLGPPAGL